VGGGQASTHSLTVGAYAPVLFHPASHFFIGLGPEVQNTVFLDQPATGSASDVRLAVSAGGWTGL
jgi:hypothetical protein